MSKIATCAAPTGILTAINSFAQMQNQNAGKANITYSATPDAKMLATAGISSGDWTNLQSALAAVNSTKLLQVLNALGLMLVVEQQPFPIAAVQPSSAPVGKQVSSLFGDLS
jgi:hypothetical protein